MGNRLSPDAANYSLRWWLEQMNPSWVMGPAEAERFAQHIAIKHYAPGEVILPAGAQARCLGLVVQGEVGVLTEGKGVEDSALVITPGHSFGKLMFEGGQPCQATHQARTFCEIWFVRHSDVLALTQGHPDGQHVTSSSDRRGRRLSILPRSWATTVGALAVLALLVSVTILLPAGRRTLSVAAMGLGQWCSQKSYVLCAEESWRAAAELAPTNADPLIALGMLYSHQGELEAAEQAFDAALALAPEWSEVHNNLGYVYASRGEFELATDAFRRALELEPGSAVAEYNLGSSLQGQGAHEEALAHYRSALALGDPTPELWANMAVAYFEMGDSEAAQRAAQEAIGTGDPSAQVYTVLGGIALRREAPDEAVRVLLQAIVMDPNHAPAHLYLGLAYQALGQTGEARRALEGALNTAGDEETRERIRRHLEELAGVAREGASP